MKRLGGLQKKVFFFYVILIYVKYNAEIMQMNQSLKPIVVH